MVDNVFGIHVIGQECRASGIMNRRTRCRQSTTTTLNKHMILMAAFVICLEIILILPIDRLLPAQPKAKQYSKWNLQIKGQKVTPDGTRTRNLLFRRQMLCHWATEAFIPCVSFLNIQTLICSIYNIPPNFFLRLSSSVNPICTYLCWQRKMMMMMNNRNFGILCLLMIILSPLWNWDAYHR